MIIRIIFFLFFLSGFVYSQDKQEVNPKPPTLTEKLDSISEKAKVKWRYNPFRKNDVERRLVGWQDPYANITRFWIGDVLSKNHLYPRPGNRMDNVSIFYSPTIATEISAVAFETGRLKYRLGVGVLAEFNLGLYKGNPAPKYGKNLVFSDYIQVEVYMDFIIDQHLKLRWIPLRHKCSHVNGDIFGDPTLPNPNDESFADVGFEEMQFALYYNWTWFTFYGGFGFAITNFEVSNYVNLFNISFGTDLRVPIWGEINFIMGFYVAANYDAINDIERTDTGYNLLGTKKSWYPTTSVGIGFEMDRVTFSFKYLRMRSRHVISYKTMDERIGFETSVYF